jgi:hypothetical protein
MWTAPISNRRMNRINFVSAATGILFQRRTYPQNDRFAAPDRIIAKVA